MAASIARFPLGGSLACRSSIVSPVAGARNQHYTGNVLPFGSLTCRRTTIHALAPRASGNSADSNAEGKNDGDQAQNAARFILEKAGMSETASSSGGGCCGGGCGGEKADAKSAAQQFAELEATFVTGPMEGNITRDDVQSAYRSAPDGPSEEKFLDIAAILAEASNESENFVFEDDLDELMV
ncbi:hypothetical protein KFL_000570240 [Klebsormidium nitens]|uniref:Uncharacterized protein n=1 Tax=Klebsormidium nitens TaxID=105231 RepID=A0A0U9HIV4_KLENI|nr:hypothetical protein KFL_000570240 [Klebsormidium nitens]|eukprot:GAQ80577.1 hypothetical protein KFL_000570240 [Klebsormidium nitens]